MHNLISKMVSAFQERGTFNPEKAHLWSEGKFFQLSGLLHPNTEGDQSCPKHLLQLMGDTNPSVWVRVT